MKGLHLYPKAKGHTYLLSIWFQRIALVCHHLCGLTSSRSRGKATQVLLLKVAKAQRLPGRPQLRRLRSIYCLRIQSAYLCSSGWASLRPVRCSSISCAPAT